VYLTVIPSACGSAPPQGGIMAAPCGGKRKEHIRNNVHTGEWFMYQTTCKNVKNVSYDRFFVRKDVRKVSNCIRKSLR